MALTPERRLELRIQGRVQGVGFRPHVHRLAHGLQLRGWVRNDHRGVELVVEGPQPQLHAFLDALRRQPPVHSRIDHIDSRWDVVQGEPAGFRIAPATLGRSGANRAATALIAPDLATCPECLAELRDPSNRRFGYPFISCTHCGPRYSVVEQLPFERQHTSLAAFPLCALCQRDYADPEDRRFHGQTISCPQCGPRLRWQCTGAGADHRRSGDAAAITAAAEALRRGQIVALQGVGGFQLLVDARNGQAVAELRRRKGRPEKPLALMAPQHWVERHCQLSGPEAELFNSSAAPILLLRRRSPAADGEVSDEVAGHSPWLGVMRPSSGVHHLLLEAFGGVVVATSANRSGEPLCTDPEADSDTLAALADGVLCHNLRIVNRIDDSVVRLAAGRPLVLRLGRGLAPCAVALPPATEPAAGRLALGAQVKGSIALGLGSQAPDQAEQALLSPDLGDLSSLAGGQHLRRTQAQWCGRHGIQPAVILCDRHGGYTASQLAATLAAAQRRPLRSVQHHHAHLLAVLAEHGLEGPELGVAWDGSGLGTDGSLWGGEGLRVSRHTSERVAMLRPFRLPGGEQALREPRRAALGLLVAAFGNRWRERTAGLPPASTAGAFTAEELSVLEVALGRALQSPLCSSVGRLFDAVASLLGLQQRCSYEAQAALALEALALEAQPPGQCTYAIALRTSQGAEPWQLDWQPLLEQLLADLSAGLPPASIALAVHQALASAIGDLAVALEARRFLLSGGCFQNQLLLERSIAALRQRDIEPLWPRQLPCNDAALPIGQLLAL
ncbi:MAG: carbamoyltransferase HypF [Synechococcaceae bacterium WB8_1B_136]|nr:carbamoyltransferase HypF [Synechococcaceae bacterium WB8_1B_136]